MYLFAIVRVFKNDPPLPGYMGKEGQNDFHDYPLGYGPKTSVAEDDPLSSSGELFAGGEVRRERTTIVGKPRVVSYLLFLCRNSS